MMHMKLSYSHKSNCYSQCNWGVNKAIAVHYMNSSSSKEFELKYRITRSDLLVLDWPPLERFTDIFWLPIKILLLILVGYQMTVTISSVTFIVSNPKHARQIIDNYKSVSFWDFPKLVLHRECNLQPKTEQIMLSILPVREREKDLNKCFYPYIILGGYSKIYIPNYTNVPTAPVTGGWRSQSDDRQNWPKFLSYWFSTYFHSIWHTKCYWLQFFLWISKKICTWFVCVYMFNFRFWYLKATLNFFSF